jgi:hypothetical protein
MIPSGVLFAVQVITGLAALVTVNVPMFGVLRRFTTFIVWAFEWVFQNKHTPVDETMSLLAMILGWFLVNSCVASIPDAVVGAIVAGADDVSFDLVGYVLVALNCILTAAYLVQLNNTGRVRPHFRPPHPRPCLGFADTRAAHRQPSSTALVSCSTAIWCRCRWWRWWRWARANCAPHFAAPPCSRWGFKCVFCVRANAGGGRGA